MKEAEEFLDRLLRPKRSDELRRVTQPFDALTQLMALVVSQGRETGVVVADFLQRAPRRYRARRLRKRAQKQNPINSGGGSSGFLAGSVSGFLSAGVLPAMPVPPKSGKLGKAKHAGKEAEAGGRERGHDQGKSRFVAKQSLPKAET